jgi:sugar phosphate isomerase/epimerase
LRLGLDTYSYCLAAGLWEHTPRENPPMTLDHFLQKAAELGLDGLQLADARHLDSLEYGYVSEVRRKADSLGLYLELGTAGTNPDHLDSMVRAAHVLGAPVVRTFVGKPRGTSGDEMSRIVAEAAAEIGQVVPLCERYGVALALENHQDLTTDELLSVLELVDSAWVGICFDTGNPLALLEEPLESAQSFGPLIKTVHLKDYQVVATRDGFRLLGCALGEGVVNLRSVLDLIQSEAPTTNINIETYIGTHDMAVLTDEYLRRLPETPAWALGRTLRLVRDRGLEATPKDLLEAQAEGELLAAEDDQVVRSVRWARHVLSRPELER